MLRFFLALTALILTQCASRAALDVRTVWELNASATAGNLNGGGFNYANANFLTNLTTDANTGNTASPIVSSASYNFAAGDVDAWVFVKSGTNWYANCWYKIASVASNKATLLAASGSGVCLNSTNGWPSPKWTASTVAGVASVGTPTSGTFGVDYSQTTTSITNNTDLVLVTATTMTSAGSPFGLNHVGNIIHVTNGTNFTQGWYEVVSVAAVTATVDRSAGTLGSTGGTFRVGGAMSLNSTLDDDLFDLGTGTNGTGAMRFFVKNGSYTTGEVISTAQAGGSLNPVVVEGYATLRGDGPTGSTRPTFDTGTTNNITTNSNWAVYNMIITGTSSLVFNLGSNSSIANSKLINTSTSTNRTAIQTGSNDIVFNSEMISYRGFGVTYGGSDTKIVYSYLHDSAVCITDSAYNMGIFGNIFEGCYTAAIQVTGGITSGCLVNNNTIYGAENKLGVGVSLVTVTAVRLFNNIIYGTSTGISAGSAQQIMFSGYNDLFNNTTNYTNWPTATTDQAVNPSFTAVSQITGTTATTSGSVLTQSGGDFSNVVDNSTYLYMVSGTGVTSPAYYNITAHTATTVTLDNAPGTSATADKVWQITLGHNFQIGQALKALGFPGAFPAGYTTGYVDIGAAQRQEGGASGGGPTSSVVVP